MFHVSYLRTLHRRLTVRYPTLRSLPAT